MESDHDVMEGDTSRFRMQTAGNTGNGRHPHSNLTMFEATRESYCSARAMFVRGPRASIDISPGWAITISAMNLAAGVSTATPCAKQPFGLVLNSHVRTRMNLSSLPREQKLQDPP